MSLLLVKEPLTMICPTCGTPAPAGDRFCHRDGTVLINGGDICRCGDEVDVDENGQCLTCGGRVDEVQRDHAEAEAAPNLVGITDIGLRHSDNQDAMAVAAVNADGEVSYVAVVCDGVSGSDGGADAAQVAAQVACEILSDVLESGAAFNLSSAMYLAILKAQDAVCALGVAHTGEKDPPETTIVATVVRNSVATVGWVGDSRAYLVTPEGTMLLTRDHSWVNAMVDSGQMTEDEALNSPLAHAIVSCLGGAEDPESPEPVEPALTQVYLAAGDRLVLCSDGLWNYAPNPEDIAVIADRKSHPSAITAARRMIAFANEMGGRDNITVAVLDV
ncbi:MAG: protein phosphatase 2C domain-containing protein [Capsulimonadaceae bacterium]